MKPLFTVHAGEYLVGSYIEEHFRDLSQTIMEIPNRLVPKVRELIAAQAS